MQEGCRKARLKARTRPEAEECSRREGCIPEGERRNERRTHGVKNKAAPDGEGGDDPSGAMERRVRDGMA